MSHSIIVDSTATITGVEDTTLSLNEWERTYIHMIPNGDVRLDLMSGMAAPVLQHFVERGLWAYTDDGWARLTDLGAAIFQANGIMIRCGHRRMSDGHAA